MSGHIDEWEQDRRNWAVAVVGGETVLGFNEWARRELSGRPVPAGQTVHFIHRGVRWDRESSAPYKCGAMNGPGVIASSAVSAVTCTDCLELMNGGSEPRPRHTPPRMVDENGLTDGVFTFYDTHETDNWTMEVVPQTTGNVEITIGESLFTLNHLDRADMLRALLHDFHYSPERGGPDGETD